VELVWFAKTSKRVGGRRVLGRRVIFPKRKSSFDQRIKKARWLGIIYARGFESFREEETTRTEQEKLKIVENILARLQTNQTQTCVALDGYEKNGNGEADHH